MRCQFSTIAIVRLICFDYTSVCYSTLFHLWQHSLSILARVRHSYISCDSDLLELVIRSRLFASFSFGGQPSPTFVNLAPSHSDSPSRLAVFDVTVIVPRRKKGGRLLQRWPAHDRRSKRRREPVKMSARRNRAGGDSREVGLLDSLTLRHVTSRHVNLYRHLTLSLYCPLVTAIRSRSMM